MKAEAALAPAVLDQLIKGIEQRRSVDVILGEDAMALAVERIAQHQRRLGILIAEDHDKIGMDNAPHRAEQGWDEAIAFECFGEFTNATREAVEHQMAA